MGRSFSSYYIRISQSVGSDAFSPRDLSSVHSDQKIAFALIYKARCLVWNGNTRGKILNLNINAPSPLIIKLRCVNKNKGSPSFSTMKNQYRDTEIPASEIFPLQKQCSTEILNSVTWCMQPCSNWNNKDTGSVVPARKFAVEYYLPISQDVQKPTWANFSNTFRSSPPYSFSTKGVLSLPGNKKYIYWENQSDSTPDRSSKPLRPPLRSLLLKGVPKTCEQLLRLVICNPELSDLCHNELYCILPIEAFMSTETVLLIHSRFIASDNQLWILLTVPFKYCSIEIGKNNLQHD